MMDASIRHDAAANAARQGPFMMTYRSRAPDLRLSLGILNCWQGMNLIALGLPLFQSNFSWEIHCDVFTCSFIDGPGH